MAEAGRESVRRLSDQVEDYRGRLSRSEKLSFLDPLTGLANRRGFEEQLNARMRTVRPLLPDPHRSERLQGTVENDSTWATWPETKF